MIILFVFGHRLIKFYKIFDLLTIVCQIANINKTLTTKKKKYSMYKFVITLSRLFIYVPIIM